MASITAELDDVLMMYASVVQPAVAISAPSSTG
jgi:hypothetical protein